MGVELYITRAEFWAQNEGKEITSDEWLAYVASDPEFRLSPENGKHFALWSGNTNRHRLVPVGRRVSVCVRAQE